MIVVVEERRLEPGAVHGVPGAGLGEEGEVDQVQPEVDQHRHQDQEEGAVEEVQAEQPAAVSPVLDKCS